MKINVKYIPSGYEYVMTKLDDQKTIKNLGGRSLPF